MDRSGMNNNYVTVNLRYGIFETFKALLDQDEKSKELVSKLRAEYQVDENWDYMYEGKAHADLFEALGEFLVPEKKSIGPFKFRFGKPRVFRDDDRYQLQTAVLEKLLPKNKFWIGFTVPTEISIYSLVSAHYRSRYRDYEHQRQAIDHQLFELGEDGRELFESLYRNGSSTEVILNFGTAKLYHSLIEKYREFRKMQ